MIVVPFVYRPENSYWFLQRATASPMNSSQKRMMLLNKDASEMEPCKIRGTTPTLSLTHRGWKARKYLLLPVEGEKCP